MSDSIIYEQPLNEIVRTCLRLEHVFQCAEHFTQQTDIWGYRAAIRSITEAMAILDRPDFKGKVKQELMRFKTSLQNLQDHHHVNSDRLQKFIEQIKQYIDYLDRVPGKLGDELRDNEFLTNIRHNLQKAGGSCNFDMPNYHYWLVSPNVSRTDEITSWFSQLDEIKNLIYLILESIRNSNTFEIVEANSGSYQRTLETNQPYQMLRVAIDVKTEVFPEMSVGRQRFSICFREPSTASYTEQVKYDLKFKLACCKL